MYSSTTDLPASAAELDRAVLSINEGSVALLDAIPPFDDKELWLEDGATSMTSWLATRYSTAWGVAREWVRVARALRNLPTIRAAFAEGRLSFDQLKALTRFVAPEDEEIWAEKAPDMSL